MGRGRSGYSFPIKELPDTSKIAIARGYELPIKWKHAREIANAIMERGMYLNEAIEFLEAVAELKKPVPFKRFKGNVGHRKGMHEWKWPAGRYPQKAARYMLKVLRNALNNAKNKGLDERRLRIIWLATHKSRKLRRRPDRRGPGLMRGIMVKTGTNVEVVVMEVEEEVEVREEVEAPVEEEEELLEEIAEEAEEGAGEKGAEEKPLVSESEEEEGVEEEEGAEVAPEGSEAGGEE